MDWKFWKRNKETVEKQSLEIMHEKFNMIEGYLQRYDDRFEQINQNMDSNEDLIQKTLRLQYKSSQEILKKLEREDEIIDKMEVYSKRYIEIERERDNLISEKEYILERYIQWLDDIDLIYHNIDDQGQEYWIQLLQNWQNQILKSLEAVGIYEIDILGKSFNHVYAESVSTVEKEDNREYEPYEVVDVLERGFISGNGILLRKVKVVTIKEEVEGRNGK